MKDLFELLDKLSKMNVSQILAVLGVFFVILAVGADFRVIVVTDEVPEWLAGVLGAFFLMLAIMIGFAPLFLDQRKRPPSELQPTTRGEEAKRATDPFFKYYVLSVVIALGVFGMIMALTPPAEQLAAARIEFYVAGAFVTVTVVWRLIAVGFYIRQSNGSTAPPIGLLGQGGKFVPYFVLLGSAALALIGLTLAFTTGSTAIENRLPILRELAILAVYLIICRLVWQVIDLWSRSKLKSKS